MNTDTVVLDGSCRLINRMDGSMTAVLKVSEFDYYTGAYEVIPKADTEVVLETSGLMMANDVTVRQIPYYETHSETGITAYIASEV